jgi:hypothetical protein
MSANAVSRIAMSADKVLLAQSYRTSQETKIGKHEEMAE